MFKLFKKKTKKERLMDEYKKLLKEAKDLSTINRAKSSKKYAEAEEILDKIDQLEENNNK